ncbi:MAG TPA: glycosyltransferase family 4 protein [Polyangiaceae bacterium]|nr:glycosyltransferase family 4 protein [Polyangiaceae bacterium]
MRILVLTTDSFGGLGGIAKYNQDLLTALSRSARIREVVVIPRMAVPGAELPARLVLDRSGIDGKAGFIRTVLRQLARPGRFDLVLCGHVHLLPIALPLALRYAAPLILCVYGTEAWNPPSSRIAASFCSRVDGVISISRITADRFSAWAGSKQEWILPNAVDLEALTPGPPDPALLRRYGLEGRTVIATLGRLDATQPLKGFDEVLEVMPRLVVERPNLSYLIMGDGTDRCRLEQKAMSLGLEGRVVFTGKVSETEKVDHYRLARAFVMPSRGEGFGFVFLEALACGVPVVASSMDGGREAVRDGLLGTLVDPRDPDDIVRGIGEALARPKGPVHEDLAHFSVPNFDARAHAFVEDVCVRSKMR